MDVVGHILTAFGIFLHAGPLLSSENNAHAGHQRPAISVSQIFIYESTNNSPTTHAAGHASSYGDFKVTVVPEAYSRGASKSNPLISQSSTYPITLPAGSTPCAVVDWRAMDDACIKLFTGVEGLPNGKTLQSETHVPLLSPKGFYNARMISRMRLRDFCENILT